MPTAKGAAALRTVAARAQKSLAFLLDIDGTLVFTDDFYFKVFQRLLTPLGHTVDKEFYAANVHGKVDADVFGKLMPEGMSSDDLLAMSRRKDALFVELYKEHVEQHGPPMLEGLPAALATAERLGPGLN